MLVIVKVTVESLFFFCVELVDKLIDFVVLGVIFDAKIDDSRVSFSVVSLEFSDEF
jgi:hypothetical protein